MEQVSLLPAQWQKMVEQSYYSTDQNRWVHGSIDWNVNGKC